MQFKGLELDSFQEEAIASIDKGHSCVVCASTGTGKTLIAEYIIHTHVPQGNHIVYTAPIKALSNQKYKDFCEEYGKENVGLLTGDTTINPQGQVLVMTTEIYRNMVLANDPLIDSISYVIFDEVHYINDIQRGTVWEESIIFSPEHIRFLALSATIPNYKEFALWISTIKGHQVDTVFYGHRPVPLEHFVFDKRLGKTTIEKVQRDILEESQFDHVIALANKKKKGKKQKHHHLPPPHHLEVIPELKTPALYFCFSRKKCSDFAGELAKKENFTSTEETRYITQYVRENITADIAKMDATKLLRHCLPKGIGFHHSGMLPQLKSIVEHLFGKGLIKILYTTETFSVGINMPAKTVVFHSVDKYDGVSMRMLNAKEYFQIAGRAGRRGIDTHGTVIALIDRKYTNLKRLEKISTVDDEPIISQFKLSINTVLNLIDTYDDKTQELLVKSNLDYFVRRRQKKKAVHIMASYRNKIKKLLKLQYITPAQDITSGGYVQATKRYYLTEKGRFAKHLYANELTFTELFYLPHFSELSDLDLLILIAAITYEERRTDYFMIKGSEKTYRRIMKFLEQTPIERDINKISLKRMINFVTCWANGGTFLELMNYSNLQEGDIIRFFRRLVDTLTQLQHADTNQYERLEALIKRIDRDLVADIK